MKDKIVPALVIVGLIAGVILLFSGKGGNKKKTGVDVKMPVLSEVGATGQEIFKLNCSQCHGENAGGTPQGPPLIHKIYEPSHHADGSFHRAATRGVISHHWRFGNMPPIRTVSTPDVARVIVFIREVQKANGIY